MLNSHRIRLIKGDGTVIDDVRASVQDKIFINDISLPVEEGDIFEQKLSSGLVRKMVVTKIQLYNMGSALDHYEITFERVAKKELSNPRSRVDLFNKYDFHPIIKTVSFRQFQDGYYKEAILNSFVEVINEVKRKAQNPKSERNGRSYDLDGDDLMNRVFGCDNQEPLIRLNNLQNSLDKAEQRGYMNIYKGIVGLRDKKAHLNFIQNDPIKTIEYLSLASLLVRLLEESEFAG